MKALQARKKIGYAQEIWIKPTHMPLIISVIYWVYSFSVDWATGEQPFSHAFGGYSANLIYLSLCRYGRRIIFYIGIATTVTGRLLTAFSASNLILFRLSAILAAFGDSPLYFAPYTIAMEISRPYITSYQLETTLFQKLKCCLFEMFEGRIVHVQLSYNASDGIQAWPYYRLLSG